MKTDFYLRSNFSIRIFAAVSKKQSFIKDDSVCEYGIKNSIISDAKDSIKLDQQIAFVKINKTTKYRTTQSENLFALLRYFIKRFSSINIVRIQNSFFKIQNPKSEFVILYQGLKNLKPFSTFSVLRLQTRLFNFFLFPSNKININRKLYPLFFILNS
jgi:hypothetical protein